MKRSGIGFALCMGIVLSFMAGKMSAYAGEEGRELQTSSSNIASTHGTQFFLPELTMDILVRLRLQERLSLTGFNFVNR